MEAQKKSAAKAKNAKKGGFNAFVVILLSFAISVSFYMFILGDQVTLMKQVIQLTF